MKGILRSLIFVTLYYSNSSHDTHLFRHTPPPLSVILRLHFPSYSASPFRHTPPSLSVIRLLPFPSYAAFPFRHTPPPLSVIRRLPFPSYSANAEYPVARQCLQQLRLCNSPNPISFTYNFLNYVTYNPSTTSDSSAFLSHLDADVRSAQSQSNQTNFVS